MDLSITSILALLISITVHEFCHAWMATALGDNTARYEGRLTVNPLAHLDPIGTILLFVAGFGWGKAVPFNPYYLRDPRIGSALISFAGPFSNFLLMVFFAFSYSFLYQTVQTTGVMMPLGPFLLDLFEHLINLNLVLMLFNLLPIPPLDGAKIFSLLIPGHLLGKVYEYRNYGYLILFLVVFSDRLLGVSILNWIIDPPLRFVWHLILGTG